MPSSRCFTLAFVLGSWLAISARAGSPEGPAGDLAPGTRVQFDRVEATRPELGRWDVGVIVRRDSLGRYSIRGDNGTTYTIRDDPRWILPEGARVTGPRWDGSSQSRPPTQQGPHGRTASPGTSTTPGTPPGQPGATAGGSAPGTRVQFDRVEATRPENGRWDAGVIVGRDHGGRLQIRGDNGILYAIRDDPRWILPEGAPLPGPKHDAYEVHPPPPGQPGSPPPQTARPADGTEGVIPGHYICSSFSEQVMGLAFRVTGPGTYTFDAGGGGTVRLEAGTRQLSFTGPLGELMRDDQLTALYITRNGKPEVAFQSARGGPVAGCFPQ